MTAEAQPPSPAEVSVVIASAHPVMREGLLALLDAVGGGIEPIGTAASDGELLSLLQEVRPDVVLLDMQLCGESETPTLTRRIRTTHHDVRVLILSPMTQGPEVCRALDDGAGGVVSKTAEAPQLVDAIRYVASGEGCVDIPNRDDFAAFPLTSREVDVLECISRGMNNAETAFALSISPFTVRAHVEHILQKLDAPDRTGAVATALRRGLIQ
jgi:DNA-binding NarL/FixJ family response regulator